MDSPPPRRRALFGYEPPPSASDGGPLSVTELAQRARRFLEGEFASVAVKGEITDVSRSQRGHIYFTLKDANSQIPAVLWEGAARSLDFQLQNGLEVVARGNLTLYAPRGRFQFICQKITPAGEGLLEAKFRALTAEYEAKGWFDESLKKPLPFLPRVIGIVTSPTGAAIHDILETLLRRHPRASVLLAPAKVQGVGASEDIARAIRLLDGRDDVEVLIVGRGGGSLEDLWAFNEPAVVEAIRRARTPVISAVGHEVDVTLADRVADVRALTPTRAGEVVVPELEALIDGVRILRDRLDREVTGLLRNASLTLDALGRSWALREPRRMVQRASERVKELRAALTRSLEGTHRRLEERLRRLDRIPSGRLLLARLVRARQEVAGLRRQVDGAMRRNLEGARADLERLGPLLESLSPLAVLQRGYSITRTKDDGRILRSSNEAAPGDEIVTLLADGEIVSRVEES